MSAHDPVTVEREGAVVVLTIDNPPVNAGSIEVRRALLKAVQDIGNDTAIEAAIVIGAGRSFIAGSDIREFGKPLEDPQLPAVIAAIQQCSKPFVAALHGAALGGGFELALGCDARVASPDAIVGFPEVTLGMIPGAGGTQYAPRLAGIVAAIEMICSGRRLRAEEARSRGLIDAIIDGELRSGAISFASSLKGRKRPLWLERVPAEDPAAIEAAAKVALRAGKNRPPVAAAIEAVKSAATLPFGEALARERSVFQTLRMGSEAAALRYLFFAERQAGKVEGLEGVTPRAVSRVGVVGAGTMGAGIAMCFADTGLPVTLTDRDDDSVQRGLTRIRGNYGRIVASGRMTADEATRRMALVNGTTNLSSLELCDLAIEAVFEDMDTKRDVFRALDRILPENALLASNTSYLNLDQIAAATQRSGHVVGLHFFNPAQTMRLLEVVRCKKTSAETLATALDIAKRLKKLAIIARVGEGFIGNRLYAAYRRHCEFMLEDGAFPEEVDTALQEFGFAMGPFAVADMSGLDIAWQMRKRLAATRDARERYVEIADRLCEQGRFGQKTGAGWYRYNAGERKGEPDPHVHALIRETSAEKGIARRTLTADEIRSRALMAIVNEAALLLDEGIAARPSDVDLVLVNGYGFPSYEGGPLFWAKRQDRSRLLAEQDQLAEATGFGFRKGEIAGLLDQMIREG